MGGQDILTGVHEGFFWLTSNKHYMGSLLKVCPEMVIGRYVAITANDSGAAKLDTQHLSSSWRLRAGVGYSPKLSSIDEIPHQLDGPDTPGFDEIYVFNSPSMDLGELCYNVVAGPIGPGKVGVFVNTFAFVIHNKEISGSGMEKLFWYQLKRLSPYAYISDGKDWLTLVTRDQNLVVKVYDRLTFNI